MRLLVCGGRDYSDADRMSLELWKIKDRHDHDLIVIHGGADGADELAGMWCARNGVACAEVVASWHRFGRSAGPIRNGWMLLLKPDLVLAFPGGAGTANMVKQAEEAGVSVRRVLE